MSSANGEHVVDHETANSECNHAEDGEEDAEERERFTDVVLSLFGDFGASKSFYLVRGLKDFVNVVGESGVGARAISNNQDGVYVAGLS